MPAPLRTLIIVIAAIFLLSGAALLALKGRTSDFAPAAGNPTQPDPGMSELTIPPFTLTTQDGLPITRDALRGHATVVSFIFTNCPFICPALTQKMRGLSRALEGTGVRFLSISVDPAHDTPASLKAYAERSNADTSRWTFATGDRETIQQLVRDGLKFALYDDAKAPVTLPDGSTMSNVVHPPFFVLVGPDAQVLGIYPVVVMPESLEGLGTRARAVDRAIKR